MTPQPSKKLVNWVFERDGYTCKDCGVVGIPGKGDGRIQIHHIIPRFSDGSNEPENLVTLCSACHKKRDDEVSQWRGLPRAPGAGRKPLQPGGAHKIAITLTDEDLAALSAIDSNTSKAIRQIIRERTMSSETDSGLTDNAWTRRVEEIRQMVADVSEAPKTESDVEFYIDLFELEFDDEKNFARREFNRQYGV